MTLSRTLPLVGMLTILGAIALFLFQEPLAAALGLVALPGLVGLALLLSVALAVGLGLLTWAGYERNAERRAERRLKEAQAERAKAEVRQVQRQSDVYVVTAKQDEAVYISDAPGLWRAAHLDPRRYANGFQTDRTPNPVELAAWANWHQAHATSKREALPDNSRGGERIGSLPAPTPPALWPDKIDLLDLLPYGSSLQNIVLGVTLDQSGQQQVIAAPLAKLVHIAVGGSSGWGKSVFLRALAYQLVAAPEPVELALIDLEATTFSPFATSSRLRCAIADTESDALNILSHLSQELEYRKQLFKAYPTAEQLSDYNRLVTEPLPLVALLVDEATALLSDKSVEEQIRTLALRARKYGIYAVLGGQDWKAASLDTAIRNQLSTRIQFRAADGSQSRVLLGTSEAARIEQVGRAYAVLPGRPRLELQAPHIDLTTIAAQAAERRLTIASPQPVSPLPQPKSALDQRIYTAITQHKPGSTISFSQLFKAQTWGMSKPTFINHVKRVVEAYDLTEKYQVGAELPENFR